MVSVQAALADSPDQHTWVINSKECDGKPLPSSNPEKYLFSHALVTRIFVSSDNDQQRCKQALTYQRTVNGFQSVESSYEEDSTMIARMARTVCRAKVNGEVIAPPVSDSIEETKQEPMAMHLRMTGPKLLASIVGSSECKCIMESSGKCIGGTLLLELSMEK